MHKKRLLTLAVLAFSATSAMADEVWGIKPSFSVYANSAYNWRGGQMSDGEPSIGGSASLSKSGFFATYALTRVKLGGADFEHDFVGGYGTSFGDFSLTGGLVKVNFTGSRNGLRGSDLSFGEVFVAAGFKGLNAKVVRNINGADANAPRLRNGDVYAEVSYMYAIGKGFSAGGELGYYWYDKSGVGATTKDNFSQQLAKVAYQYDKNLSFSANYQFGGKDAFGQDWKHNKKFIVGMSYAF